MKICHFISYSAESHYLVNIGKGLADKGFSVLCGTLFETGRTKPEWMESEPNIEYFCLNAKSKKDFPAAVLKLAKILRQEKVEVLQTHLYEASFVGILAAKLAGIPLKILTRHYLDQMHQIGNKLAIALDRWETREANKIVVLSNAVRDYMISHERADGGKIEVIYQGFDFEKFSASPVERAAVRAEFGFAENDFVIGTIANFFPTKGHRFLLSAAKILENEIPNLKLFFVGSSGQENIERLTADLEMSEKVLFSGFRRDVAACMGAMDLVVHPSLSEAFCQVLIESMSVGKPLISTDVGGAKEVVTNNETGILIPPGNVEAIVEAIRKVYFDSDFRQKISVAGQKSVRERFTVANMVNQQADCYQRWMVESKK